MYDIDLKNVKKGRIFYVIFLAIGLITLAGIISVFAILYTIANSLDSSTMSTGVEIQTSKDDDGATVYSPIYSYSVDGKNYVCGSNMSSSIQPSSDNKTVYYDSKNPERCVTEYSKSHYWIILPFVIIPTIFITFSAVGLRRIHKRIAQIKELNQNGKLIKGIPYHLEDTNMTVNDIPLQRPVIEYTLASGSTITLRGDTRNDGKRFDEDGLVDLVIDESNPDNYYIDFEINRITGNSSADYYHDPNA